MGRAEWGPLPTSLLRAAEYQECVSQEWWQTPSLARFFCFLSLFSCDDFCCCLSAEPAPMKCRHGCASSGSGSCSQRMVQPFAAIQGWPRAQRGRRSTRPAMAMLLWSSCTPAPWSSGKALHLRTGSSFFFPFQVVLQKQSTHS